MDFLKSSGVPKASAFPTTTKMYGNKIFQMNNNNNNIKNEDLFLNLYSQSNQKNCNDNFSVTNQHCKTGKKEIMVNLIHNQKYSSIKKFNFLKSSLFCDTSISNSNSKTTNQVQDKSVNQIEIYAFLKNTLMKKETWTHLRNMYHLDSTYYHVGPRYQVKDHVKSIFQTLKELPNFVELLKNNNKSICFDNVIKIILNLIENKENIEKILNEYHNSSTYYHVGPRYSVREYIDTYYNLINLLLKQV